MTKKILLADDSLTIQKVVELTFSDSEYDLVCVSNGQKALDRIAAGELPDLILADVVMPEKNGYEVCEAIKANPSTARVPVVLLSGTFEPFDRERAERLGCDAIVSKPFDSQQLLRQVEVLLSRPASEAPVAATVAIPTMPNLVAPPPPPPETPVAESGFKPEDFTGSIRVPARVAGGADLFEEEYGQADVESAIAAFEKAHPEFTYADDGSAAPPAGDGEPLREESHAPGAKDSEWMTEEAEIPPPVVPAPAPFWVPRAPEPDVTPIPFGADDSQSRRPTGPVPVAPAPTEPMRADEAPTQQIPLAAEYAALSRTVEAPADRDTDPTHPKVTVTERTEEIAVIRESGPLGTAAASVAEPSPAEPVAAVPADIEALAQSTSIGQLKEMLSSVSRPEGGLTDDEIDRLAARVVERLSERIVREIAWEVIPDVAEVVIKQRIKELEAGVE
ncbi:MAG TPA: response regulator [Thermoanaerobaculia bacterium]|nr:response regulator [Thermoanaerobaculia bacterium]